MEDVTASGRRASVMNLVSLILVALTAAILLSPSASAHLPEFYSAGDSYENPVEMGDISTSHLFYGDLPHMSQGDPEGARYFTFEGEEGEFFEFVVGGKYPSLASPGVLLVGPGLPQLNGTAESIVNYTGVEIPEGLGVVGWKWLPYGHHWFDLIEITPLFEPFTQTRFNVLNCGSLSLPSSGTYYIVVTGEVVSDLEEPEYTEYFLMTGSEERFTVADFILNSWYWCKVQSSWGVNEDYPFFTPTLVVVSLGLALDYGSRKSRGMIGEWSQSKVISHYTGTAGALLMVGIGANQILLLTFFSDLHEWKGIVFLVLTIQAACVVIGLLALRATYLWPARPEFSAAVGAAAVTGAALLFGAGMILGPVLFSLGAVIAWTSWCLEKRKRRKNL